ncbi:MAG: pirin family protein [Bdellovibrionales bacterium]
MLQIRRAEDRGHADRGWLRSHHTFSFADYHDPNFMGFRVLRVINEDYIEAGQGFPMHAHQDMEILTYVVDGVLEHADTLGNKSRIRPGEIQRMSAGTGIRHSEFNPSADQTTHLLQIWILPDRKGVQPSYGQKSFTSELGTRDFTLLASSEGRDGSVTLHQDVDVYAARWSSNREAQMSWRSHRFAWLQVITGPLTVNGSEVGSGDGLAVANEKYLIFNSQGRAEFLLFDLP